MPRMKKTQKRSRDEETSVEPPPSNHPLAKWFLANEDLIFYELRLAGRKEIPPRTLLYLVTYVLEPRVTGHGNVADEDIVLMWAMVNEVKINWPYLILHHMLRLKEKYTFGGIGYLCLWTRIFNHLGIDVSNENVKTMNVRSEIMKLLFITWEEVKMCKKKSKLLIWVLEVIRVHLHQVMKNHP
ncbi:hypothetical protein PIB30_012393 [Stylosanthes scabra]|uniref:Uncharacterized protein n=1 Tax=Stylosanthes scabra TaxID=79078 RepID=A0ABU6R6B5_9FABA|nr:hypothetical protein [Stylosanthes scabra]